MGKYVLWNITAALMKKSLSLEYFTVNICVSIVGVLTLSHLDDYILDCIERCMEKIGTRPHSVNSFLSINFSYRHKLYG